MNCRRVDRSITDVGNRNSQLLKILQYILRVSSPYFYPGHRSWLPLHVGYFLLDGLLYSLVFKLFKHKPSPYHFSFYHTHFTGGPSSSPDLLSWILHDSCWLCLFLSHHDHVTPQSARSHVKHVLWSASFCFVFSHQFLLGDWKLRGQNDLLSLYWSSSLVLPYNFLTNLSRSWSYHFYR